jgi:hypothetical protein
MKLIVITSLYEFSKEIEAFLRTQQVLAYFEMDVQGFEVFENNESHLENWFVSGPHERPTNSLGIFAFIENGKASCLMETLRDFDKEHGNILNAFSVNVEESV